MGSFYNNLEKLDDEEYYQYFTEIHEDRLRLSGIPECKWKTLCKKLRESIFDAGENFIYLPEESSINLQVFTTTSMSPSDEQHIYLIDHAWTYYLNDAKKVLEEVPSLVERMKAIMNIADEDDNVINSILKKMWLYNDCSVFQYGQTTTSSHTVWHILDEFGSRIRFSDEPNFHMVPFLFSGAESLMYTLLFPRTEISEGDEVTTTYPGSKADMPEAMKNAIKYPWVPSDFSQVDFTLSEPSVEYFASGRGEDILPDSRWMPPVFDISPENQLAVYSNYSDVTEFLTHPLFKIVAEEKDANILWLSNRKYNIKHLTEDFPNFCYISQFPSEQVLINKDLLAAVCRRAVGDTFNCDTLESYPDWLPTTFNLKTELPEFISYFQNREKRNLDNIWICKPFNLARGLDISITENLAQIIRMGTRLPKVACKYITDPVLFPAEDIGLVKMDLRYIVLLKSVDPLEVYVYDRFWIRFANKPFVLEDFSDYERHFTVMNYCDFSLRQMYCHDFIERFENYYASYKWSEIQDKINKMIKDIFVAAISKESPAGIGKFNGSRAVYGLDIMLRWDKNHDVPQMKPAILEVNWMPDCKRACQYYPEFYNDIFSVLFLEETRDKHVTLL